jgi:hypothetical protein
MGIFYKHGTCRVRAPFVVAKPVVVRPVRGEHKQQQQQQQQKGTAMVMLAGYTAAVAKASALEISE